jgi:acyl carrier protein
VCGAKIVFSSLDSAVKDRVQKFVEEKFLAGAGLDSVQPNESFLENGIIDSTGVLEFIDFLEETFNIKIMDEELVPDNLDSLNKVVDFIERKIEPKKV